MHTIKFVFYQNLRRKLFTKIVFIKSVAGSETYKDINNRTAAHIFSFSYSFVHDLEDARATDYIAKDYAIPFVGWETNHKRPVRITFPK